MFTKKINSFGKVYGAFIILFIGIFSLSCSKEEVENLNDELVKKHNQIEYKNGYLIFPNQESLDQISEELNNMSEEEQDEWENAFGFTSLRSIFEEAVLEDAKNFGNLEKELSTEEFSALNEAPHSAFVLKNSALFKFHPEGWFEINLAEPRVASFVNAQGIVKVGREIRKYTPEGIKVIEDGDNGKIRLLNGITSSDTKKNIRVINYQDLNGKFGLQNASSHGKQIVSSGTLHRKTGEWSGKYRVIVYDKVNVEYRGYDTFRIIHYLEASSFKKNCCWNFRYSTPYLSAYIYSRTSYHDKTDRISAYGSQHTIAAPLTTYDHARNNPQYAFYSSISAWGHNNSVSKSTMTF